MTSMHNLWLPVLLSAVVVFFASFVLHTFIPFHSGDYGKVQNEGQFMDAVRPLGIPPGDYMVPRPASMQDMRSAEFTEKMTKGPVVVMTVMPSGPAAMRDNLIQWFLYLLVVGVFCAYVAGRALPSPAAPGRILRFVGVTAFLAYACGLWQLSIWYRRSWNTTTRYTIDAVVYAALTGAVFVWLWPK